MEQHAFVMDSFEFNFESTHLETLTRTTQGGTQAVQLLHRYAVEKKPQPLERIKISSIWYKVESQQRISELRQLIDATVQCRMGGRDLGSWILLSLNETQTFFNAQGQPQKIKFELELMNYENHA